MVLLETFLCNHFEFEPVVHGETSLLNFSFLQLWWPSCSVERRHFNKVCRVHYEERFCENILNFDE